MKRRLQTTCGLLGICLLLFTACQPPAQNPARTPGTASDSRVANSARRDLSQDEACGGHVLRKHVGRSDEQLRARLEQERHISAASTYSDRRAAELAVGQALQQQQDRVRRWLEGQGGHPNLVLDYDADPQHPVGRSLQRGEDRSEPCSHALVVLKWAAPNEFCVLTSYPECRR